MNKEEIFLTKLIIIILNVLAVSNLTARRIHTSNHHIDNKTTLKPTKVEASAQPIESTLIGFEKRQSMDIEENKSQSTKKNEIDAENTSVKPPVAHNGNIVFHKGMAPTPEEIEIAKEPQKFAVKFSGYIKPEFFWDSRECIGVRGDQLLIYPEPKELDRCGRDIQAHPAYSMCALETRLRVEIIGPDVLGAKALGYIEGDFFGVSELTKNVFRMRHAYTQLNWETISLLFGQYWHPMFINECTPDTIEFNGGTTMDPFKRAPQIRLTKRFKPFELIVAALAEVDFTNDGPLGPNCNYLRDAVIPDLSADLRAWYFTHLYGVAVDFKRLVPRLKTDFNVKTEESIYSAACSVYATFNWESFILRLKATVAQNGADLGLLGGYAVHSIQPESDKRTYSSLTCASIWADFNRVNSTIEPGCFIGFVKNIGSSKTIIPEIKKDEQLNRSIYGLGTEFVDYVFRIQPRLRWFVKPVVFGLELDYTRASYGQPSMRGTISDRPSYLHPDGHTINPGPTSNIRFLFAAFYYF